ncbi:MAG TPA: hypothetical protein VJ575_01270 [Pseudogulbenkiania sp.]|nr:hypothetical protein [Pseudogulbenkiania sp.]
MRHPSKLYDSIAVRLLITASANALTTSQLVRYTPSTWHSDSGQ